jgi:hypothetical protein
MAIPALASDFKEFLKSLNSNHVEYLLIGGLAPKTSPESTAHFASSDSLMRI